MRPVGSAVSKSEIREAIAKPLHDFAINDFASFGSDPGQTTERQNH
jgi:hypothetical protein